jgi:PAS domain S-box-containing protein
MPGNVKYFYRPWSPTNSRSESVDMKMHHLAGNRHRAMAVFAAAALFVAGAGLLFYHLVRVKIQTHEYNELAAISELKSLAVSEWLEERRADARVLSSSPVLARNVGIWLKNTANPTAALHTKARLEAMLLYGQYSSIILSDAAGRVRAAFGKNHYKGLGEATKTMVRRTAESGQLQFSDFYLCDLDQEVHLDFLTPLLDGDKVTAVVILRVDPTKYLFPLIQSWPVPRKSSETLIIRREGDSALFLNDLRFRPQAAMRLKIPLTDTLLPAAMAALGKKGMVEGHDYRGVRVVADVRPIPHSPWFMVAKIDADEINRPVRNMALMVAGLVLVLLLTAGMTISGWYQRQQKQLYKELHQAELERKALASHYEWVLKNANDIVFLADDKQRLIEANDRALEAYGYDRKEMIGLPVASLRSPAARKQLDQQLSQIRASGGLRYQTEHIRKNGQVFPVEISAKYLEIEGKKFFHGVVQDITEKKRAEAEIAERNRFLQLLHECSLGLSSLPEGTDPGDALTEWLKKISGGYAVTFGRYDNERKEIVLKRILMEPGVLGRVEAALGKRILEIRFPVSPENYRLITAEAAGVRSSLHEVSFGAIPKAVSATIGVILGVEKYAAIAYKSEGMLYGTSVIAFKKGQTVQDMTMLKAFGALGAVTLRRVQAEQKMQQAYEELQASYEEIEANNQELAAVEEELRQKNEELTASEQELKAAEEELRQQVEALELAQGEIKRAKDWSENIINLAPNIVVGLGENSKILLFNKYAEKITGRQAEEVMGKSWIDLFIPEEKRQEIYGVWRDIVKNKRVEHNYENPIIGRNNEEFIIAWSNTVLTEDGKFKMVLSMGVDVTEKKRAEEKLLESENKYRLVFEAANVGKSITLPGGEVHTNQAFCDMLGYTCEEMNHKKWQDLTLPEDIDQSRQMIDSILRGEKNSARFVKRYLRKDGSVVWGDVSTVARRDAGGKLLHFITTVVDITERKQAEEKIHHQLAELQRWQAVMLDREDRVMELKNEINELLVKSGQPPRYPSAELKEK